jgi:hypothetical protein
MSAILSAALLGGCRVNSGVPKTSCVTDVDCNDGYTCQQQVCVASAVVSGGGSGSGGGGCASIPAPACSSAEGNLHPIDHSELLRLLPGRWFWCSGDSISGMPLKIGPSDTIGFEFNADATLWWFLVDDGHGNPVHRSGFQAGGTVEVIGMPDFVQLNLVETGGSWFPLNVSFTDGPPLHMRIISGGPGAYYIHDDTGCGGAVDGPTDLGTSSGGGGLAFGGMCDANVVTPESCPTVGGVVCSICQYAQMKWQCVQPCHLAMNECTAPQTCVALDDYTLSGCIGYDGYCQ